MSNYKQTNESLILNAACASQHEPLLNNKYVQEAVEDNCIKPLRKRIAELEEELKEARELLDTTPNAVRLMRPGHQSLYVKATLQTVDTFLTHAVYGPEDFYRRGRE